MISSSLVGITQADTRLPDREILRRPARFASGSISRPSQAEAAQIRLRTSGEFSPMPAVNTRRVDAAKHRRQRADFLGRPIDEEVDRQPC